jgi:hypothetical protein
MIGKDKAIAVSLVNIYNLATTIYFLAYISICDMVINNVQRKTSLTKFSRISVHSVLLLYYPNGKSAYVSWNLPRSCTCRFRNLQSYIRQPRMNLPISGLLRSWQAHEPWLVLIPVRVCSRTKFVLGRRSYIFRPMYQLIRSMYGRTRWPEQKERMVPTSILLSRKKERNWYRQDKYWWLSRIRGSAKLVYFQDRCK